MNLPDLNPIEILSRYNLGITSNDALPLALETENYREKKPHQPEPFRGIDASSISYLPSAYHPAATQDGGHTLSRLKVYCALFGA